ncbi:MAG: phosphonopyruvate decarboxylase [Flavobacteriaceae bacterium]|nr:phosphonopyruvate decarboxylase [Flavobacteriaceae bacterium]
MIDPNLFIDFLIEKEINFYSGVPDSLLKELSFYFNKKIDSKNHKIAANEGAAIGLAAGHHLATGKTPLVYFQNSGLGNAINPLLSLCDSTVYKIPMIILIGWRGEPGFFDEPQHIKQGAIQEKLLNTLEIPYEIIDNKLKNYNLISSLISKSKIESRPVALLIKKGTFSKFENKKHTSDTSKLMLREKVLKEILNSEIKNGIFITTTGKTSREFYELRKKNSEIVNKDFLTIGSMGHCSQIALGISLFNKNDVYCIDGDGSVIMHMGSLTINGTSNSKNFKHIILNNGSHESVGGQPTVGKKINFSKIAKNCGYKKVKKISTYTELKDSIKWLNSNKGPLFLEILIKNGSRKNLGRPKESPYENKLNFMKKINNE